LKLLDEEAKIEFSDVDVLNRIRCMACLPDDDYKSQLWQHYINKDKFAPEQFSYSVEGFYNKSNR